MTPKEYEKQVVAWLRNSGHELASFRVDHLEHLSGPGGDYEFDAVARFTVFHGAQITVLVECKRYSDPVERERVLALSAKIPEVKAHKAMMFSTAGFQSGALRYAEAHGIATVTFVDGIFLYETRGVGPTPPPPPWVRLPKYAGIFIRMEGNTLHQHTMTDDDTEALEEWLGRAGA